MSNRKKHRYNPSLGAGRTFAGLIFAFLLALVLTVLSFAVIADFAVKEDFVLKSFDQEYASYLKEAIEEGALDYTLPASISTDVVSDLFSEEQVLEDSRSFVHAMLNGGAYSPDMSELKATLTERVENYLSSSEAADEETIREITDSYVSDITEIYENAIQVPGVSAFIKIRNMIDKYALIAIIALAVVAVILLILCLKSTHNGIVELRFAAYATGGAAVMTLAAPLIIYLTKTIEHISIATRYLYHILTGYLTSILICCFAAAVCWIVITIIVALIAEGKRRRAMRAGI